MEKTHPLAEKYLRVEMLPHRGCSGCGIGMLVKYTLMAFDELKVDPEKLAWVTGVGCSSRNVYSLWKGDNVDAVHGRALAVATGLKLARPELSVIVYTGDGDCLAIGGNQFIHACRRNIPLTVIMVNNQIYGMTGGQVAPTTPLDYNTMTTPYGCIETPFDGCKLAAAAGAVYVARWTVFQPKSVVSSIKKGMEKNGLSFIEVISPCPVQFGRYALKKGDPVELANWIRGQTVTSKKAETMAPEELTDKFVTGEFVDIKRTNLVEGYKKLIERCGGKYPLGPIEICY